VFRKNRELKGLAAVKMMQGLPCTLPADHQHCSFHIMQRNGSGIET